MGKNKSGLAGRFAGLVVGYLLLLVSCRQQGPRRLAFAKDPDLKIGFSTQNFQKAMPFNVETLTTCMEYAAHEGYSFVELRDYRGTLTTEQCQRLAATARKLRLDVIYEFQVGPLDSAFRRSFTASLANTLLFPGPGILRGLLSQSEFEADSTRKGWTKEELIRVANILDSAAALARLKKVQLIVENLNEPFFGDTVGTSGATASAAQTYYGLSDLFAMTSLVGLQFDIGNPFRNTDRVPAAPARVAAWLPGLGSRWVTTHLKTLQGGNSQPFLTESPLPVEEAVEMMGRQKVLYAVIELLPVTDKQACFDNHAKSIRFLKEKGILIK